MVITPIKSFTREITLESGGLHLLYVAVALESEVGLRGSNTAGRAFATRYGTLLALGFQDELQNLNDGFHIKIAHLDNGVRVPQTGDCVQDNLAEFDKELTRGEEVGVVGATH